jgi:hypothetical protein
LHPEDQEWLENHWWDFVAATRNREWREEQWPDFVAAMQMSRSGGSDAPALTFRMPPFDVAFRSVREYEASPCWRLVRSSWNARHENIGCFFCGNTFEIELHHLRYDPIGYSSDWKPLDNVIPLCHWHHYEMEKRVKAGWPRATAHLIFIAATHWPDALVDERGALCAIRRDSLDESKAKHRARSSPAAHAS